MHGSTSVHHVAKILTQAGAFVNLFFFGRQEKHNVCGSLRVNVCVSRLSGSVCVARCLPWGFVVVVGGLLAAQTTKEEVSLFSVFLSACVCA